LRSVQSNTSGTKNLAYFKGYKSANTGMFWEQVIFNFKTKRWNKVSIRDGMQTLLLNETK